MRYVGIYLALAVVLSGCASGQQAETVKASVVKVTASDFCEVMKGILPASHGKPRWSVRNVPATIDDARRIGAAVDKRCVPPRSSKPTS